MQKNSLKFLALLFIAVACGVSCSSIKNGAVSYRQKGDDSFVNGRYAEALEWYCKLDSASRDSLAYYRMTVSALKIGDVGTALRFVDKARCYTDAAVVEGFCAVLDSLPENLSAVENERNTFDKIAGQQTVSEKLSMYYNSVGNKKLVEVYPDVVSADVKLSCFTNYLKYAKASKSDDELRKMCESILKLDPDQFDALKYIGVHKCESAVDDYKKAMAEYNKNKNNTTYAYLKRDLKRVSTKFKDARTYLDKAHNIDASDQMVIKCLIVINERLENNDRAKQLKKLLSE